MFVLSQILCLVSLKSNIDYLWTSSILGYYDFDKTEGTIDISRILSTKKVVRFILL